METIFGIGCMMKNPNDFMSFPGSKEKPEAEVANDPPTQPEETLETSEVEVGPWLLGRMDFEGSSPKDPKCRFFWDVG